jgi:hypothetical protein
MALDRSTVAVQVLMDAGERSLYSLFDFSGVALKRVNCIGRQSMLSPYECLHAMQTLAH